MGSYCGASEPPTPTGNEILKFGVPDEIADMHGWSDAYTPVNNRIERPMGDVPDYGTFFPQDPYQPSMGEMGGTGIRGLLQPLLQSVSQQHMGAFRDKVDPYVEGVQELTKNTFPNYQSALGMQPLTTGQPSQSNPLQGLGNGLLLNNFTTDFKL